jgi:MATE family multidrug resistance protein
MTLMASRFGAEYLAAQSVLTTLASISYQIPFPVSIAASTRIANLIGAGLVEPAKTAGRVVSPHIDIRYPSSFVVDRGKMG